MDATDSHVGADAAAPEPQRHIGYLIRRAQQLHVATWSRLVPGEISSVQYSVLAILDRLGQASQRELCDEVDLDRSTVADLVMRMERRGLIERERDPGDNRRKTVRLTPEGKAERDRLAPLVVQVQQELTSALTAVQSGDLRRLLRRLLAD